MNGRTSGARWRLTIVVGALVVLSAACDPRDLRCKPGATRCQGDVHGLCVTSGDTLDSADWRDSPCPIACREAGGEARCVDSAEPLDACVYHTTANTHDVCFNGALAYCFGDYPLLRPPCESGTRCIEAVACSGAAVCAIDDTPEPRCAGASSGAFCDSARVRTVCQCGLVGFRQDCGGADLCHELGNGPRCTLSPTPDPRCGEPAPLTTGFCIDDMVYECWFGFVVSTADCPGGCVEIPGFPPACRMAPTPL